MRLKSFLIFPLLAVLVFGCKNPADNEQGQEKYYSKVYEISDGKYGYDVYEDSSVFIRQVVIPGIEGRVSFINISDAEKVSTLVVEKLNNGMFPPSVTKHEIDSLNLASINNGK